MQTLSIERTAVITAFKNADTSGKKLLDDLFPEQKLTGKITDRVKTVEDALLIKGITMSDLVKPGYTKEDIGRKKVELIIEVLNEGWYPNWDNHSEYKYYPWFNMSGSGLSYYVCDHAYSHSYVSSRLCLKSAELAKYIGTQFTKEYAEFML